MSTILIVANQTLPSEALATTVSSRIASGNRDFHVVVPATPPPGGGMTWDEDAPRAAAEERLAGFQGQLSDPGRHGLGRDRRSRPGRGRRDAAAAGRCRDPPLDAPAGVSRWLRQDIEPDARGDVGPGDGGGGDTGRHAPLGRFRPAPARQAFSARRDARVENLNQWTHRTEVASACRIRQTPAVEAIDCRGPLPPS